MYDEQRGSQCQGRTFSNPVTGERAAFFDKTAQTGGQLWRRRTQCSLAVPRPNIVTCGLARDGKTDNKGTPNLFQAALLFREFRDTVRLAPPASLVKYPLFAILAPVARAIGYAARDPRYERPES